MRTALRVTVLLILAAAVLELYTWPRLSSDVDLNTVKASEDSAKRGEYLVYAGGCIACHMAEDGSDALSGGKGLETAYGTFYVPNISPDRDAGIGSWDDHDFVRALRHGVSPSGDHYYPAFPFTSYTGMTVEDALAIKAYLFSQPPVARPNRRHELAFPFNLRWLNRYWKALYFQAHSFRSDSARNATWNRGAYLVRHLGHCSECHTPRNFLGAPDDDYYLAGAAGMTESGDPVPNITPHPDGLADWTRADLTGFMEFGMDVDGDYTGGDMADVIDHNLSKLSNADRVAIAEYLMSIEPLPDSP